jgi:hypothetical protein
VVTIALVTRLPKDWRARLDDQIAGLIALGDSLDSCIGCGCLSMPVGDGQLLLYMRVGLHEYDGSPLFGHHPSWVSQSSCVPPAAVNTSRSSRRNLSGSVSQVPGVVRSDEFRAPSTVAHCQPLRKLTAICGRARRFASFTLP